MLLATFLKIIQVSLKTYTFLLSSQLWTPKSSRKQEENEKGPIFYFLEEGVEGSPFLGAKTMPQENKDDMACCWGNKPSKTAAIKEDLWPVRINFL
jgi:hypothetical protein